jgi:energy-coupling factor transporter ATP-binding protein EcfA2
MMISVNDLSFGYQKDKPILRNVSFSLEGGKSLLVSGDSGIGKSTLLNCLCGIIPRNIQGEFSGTVLIDGRNVSELSTAELPYYVAIVPQTPRMFLQNVESEMAFVLENLNFPVDEMRKRIDKTLETVNLTEYRHVNPSKLSGGQLKMAALASIMILPPKVLLLDEISSGLDGNALAVVRGFVAELKHMGGVVVASEHVSGLTDFDEEITL